MNKIDLHMHSNCSMDGEFSIQELLTMAANKNMNTISIADHNCTRAYQGTFDTMGVNVLPAVELDCCFQEKEFHLLGYGIDPFDPIYQEIENHVIQEEQNASGERLRLIKEHLQLEIDEDKLNSVSEYGIYVPETICEIAMADERNKNNPFLQPYFPNGERSDNPYVNFYWDYCSKGKVAYVELSFMTLQEAIQLYRKQNACIVLAHPGNNVKEDKDLLEDFILLGIDGLEVYSSYHSDEQIAFYRQYAQEYHLIESAGSDFHGKTKPSVHMGNTRMPEEDEKALATFLNVRFNK